LYHDELGGQLGLTVDLAVEFIVLLNPVHRADGDVDAVVAAGTVIVGDDHLVDEVDDLSGFLLVD
jgi:6,7-dimethyl-8-ribityllumazine synthase